MTEENVTTAPTATTPEATAPQEQTTTQTSQPNNETAGKVDPAPEQAIDKTDKKADEAKAEKAKEGEFLFDEDKPKEENSEDGEKKEGEEDGEKDPALTVEQLEIPEDMPVSEEMAGSVNEVIKEHGLSKEASQAVINLGVKMQQQQIEAWQSTKAQWREEIMNDPDVGGANAEKSKEECNRVIRQFVDSPEHFEAVKQDLILLGLGNKLSFVKLMNNIAKATGNDSANPDDPAKNTNNNNSYAAKAKRMYPDMNE